MMIFCNSTLVFLSVPKTGTHAYQAALAPRADMVARHPTGLKHISARGFNRTIRGHLGANREDYTFLAVIREPVSWLGSWYRYRARAEIAGQAQSTQGMSFEDFVRAYVSGERPAYADVGTQGHMLTDKAGICIVEHLFRYDAQPALCAFLSERLKETITEPARKNVSPQGDLTLPNGVIRRLNKKFAAEFDLYEQARS